MKQSILIKAKIKALKEEFKKHSTFRVREMYNILSEIVRLRHLTKKSYRARSLEFEKGLHLHSYQIRYIFSIQHISTESKRLVKKGRIKESTVCYLIFRNKLFREATLQNKLVQAHLQGKITSAEISELKGSEIKDFLTNKKNFRTNDHYFLAATKTLRSMLCRIKKKQTLLKKSQWKKGLVSASNNLNKFLKEIK